MTITVEDAKKIMEDVKANLSKLALCDNHLFEYVDAGERKLGRVHREYRCQHCGGTIDGNELHWYMVGRAHGNVERGKL